MKSVAVAKNEGGLDAAESEAEEDPGDGYQHTVLVVDDEPETSELLRFVLRPLNCRIVWAATGSQGLRLAAGEVPDLAVLDLHMPGIGGKELCRRLREQERVFSLPILILTGDTRVEQEAACLGIGADDYLVKTAPPLRILARVRRMLMRYRYQADARGVIRAGGASLDMPKHRLRLPDAAELHLTAIESAFCALLMSAGGNPVPHKVICKKLFNAWPEPGSERLRKHVSNVKRKFGRHGYLIESLRGEGYRFNPARADP